MLVAACQGGGGATKAKDEPPPKARILVSPANKSEDVRPEEPITVRAKHGKLRSVTVTSEDDDELKGKFNKARTKWWSLWPVSPDEEFTVEATATNVDGRKTTKTTSFRTLDPEAVIDITSLNLVDDQTVGVGMPIVVKFDKPVFNKKNVERSLELRMSEPVKGVWYWANRKELRFRPKEYWPEGNKIEFLAHFNGVRAAEDTYGVENVSVEFEIGEEHVTTIDTDTHEMTVEESGEVIKTFDISAGKSSTPSPNGTYVAFRKDRMTIMDSATIGIPKGSPGYYRLEVPYTVKFTFSGIYTHSMPSTVGAQGQRNVSHGCINMAPSAAEWYYDWSQVGDIIEVEGTSRELDMGNGWTDWARDWEDMLEKSALGEPVMPEPLESESPSPSNSQPAKAKKAKASPQHS